MKDAVRLLVYLVATVLFGAVLAPPLYWLVQLLLGTRLHDLLGRYDFETFFHRALLLAAIILLWPLAKSLRIRSAADLGLEKNPARWGDFALGFAFSVVPLLGCGAALLGLHVFALRSAFDPTAFLKVLAAAIVVPLIEEAFFRGLVLGLLLRGGKRWMPILTTSAFYSIVHFLKAPNRTPTDVTWLSGFNSIAHAFAQFADPVLVAAGFTTLFLIGWILADARIRTRSLWLPIGLHAGWILASGVFNKIARREIIALPWLGKNLLVGIVPLLLASLTWLIMRGWLKYVRARAS